MTGAAGQCPQCGAPVRFRWAQAVQTTCEYCNAILVRHDLDLEKVGTVAERLPEVSRIQVGTRGRFGGRAFTVTGRIAYEYARGGWSEWHLAFDEGRSAWLSDAQAEYAITVAIPPPEPLPSAGAIREGDTFEWGSETYHVTALTRARYRGVEGELPFEYWDKDEVLFADLRSGSASFATIDYSEDPPLLFRGKAVDFGDLELTDLRPELAERRTKEPRALRCASCGAPIELRTGDHALNVACGACGSVLDAKDPSLKVLQRAAQATKVKPLIPIGARGTFRGAEYDVVGLQQRTIRVEGTAYSWREYLLFHPERGFRYLTEYDGHWNDVLPLRSLPKPGTQRGRPVVHLDGTTFKHFQKASAETTFALGEFPWEVRIGDKASVDDFVAPPRMLSSEKTAGETTWSVGEYTPGARIWEAFQLPGRPPRPRGVYANQPSPHAGTARQVWRTFLVLLAAFVTLGLARLILPHSEQVLRDHLAFVPSAPAEEYVSNPFEVRGRTSNLAIGLDTDLDNRWAYYQIALIDQGTGAVREVGREVSYYHGVDGGESWSEGDRDEVVRIARVPAGTYVLHVLTEGDQPVRTTLTVRRDTPVPSFWLLAFVALLAPMIFLGYRAYAFEQRRWAESDYAPTDDD